jgi:nucleotide-binding universal stress UspA family protein
MAEKYNAEIYLLYVARNLHIYSKFRETRKASASILDKTLKELESMMDKFCTKHLLGCPNFRRKVALGEPGQVIVKIVESENIDLIIMGTHGRRGLEHTLFGTVAKYVVMHSAAPVLVVNPFKVKDQR